MFHERSGSDDLEVNVQPGVVTFDLPAGENSGDSRFTLHLRSNHVSAGGVGMLGGSQLAIWMKLNAEFKKDLNLEQRLVFGDFISDNPLGKLS